MTDPTKESRLDDRPIHESVVERRRFPRAKPSEPTHVEDASGRRLGVVADVSDGGFRIIPESEVLAQAFGVGKEMQLTLVGESGFRTTIRATVIYSTAFAIGLEFVFG